MIEGTIQDWRTNVERAIEPLLASRGFELVVLEYIPNGHILRLYVDHPNGVSLEDCSGISRTVGDVLDAEGYSDKIQGRYTLEVSSPGLDRPLVKPEHFRKRVGACAKVTIKTPMNGRRNFKGILVAADELEFQLDVDGQVHGFRYDTIASARLVPEL